MNLCKTCEYGHFTSGSYEHRDLIVMEPDDKEPWHVNHIKEASTPAIETRKISISYCYFPHKLKGLALNREIAFKEFHDVQVSECNIYQKIEV